jgi:hypothetical protein|tara:strand:- start:749 stop:1744 length:996 start_codon:yes stop_codon:yes gene_type:complete
MAYTSIDNPELYFQVKLYTGNGGTNAITFDGDENMSPDLVWLKMRSNADNHTIFNTTSGATKRIFSNLTQQESTESTSLTSFDSDGFTLGSDALANGNTKTFVAWAWKESATAGFDILKYEGNATNRTISHSLSAVPHWIVIKNLESTSSSAEHWLVYHKGTGNTHGVLLNEMTAKIDDATYFQDTDPTSSVFSIGTADRCNKNNEDNIAFLWSEKQGFSKFGKFTGNGNANGPFIHLGFRPAWVVIRRVNDSTHWQAQDNKRQGFNSDNERLYLNDAAAEQTANFIDLLSNGFKCITSDAGGNGNGDTYIYMAFAESPFVNSKGVPNNAR